MVSGDERRESEQPRLLLGAETVIGCELNRQFHL